MENKIETVQHFLIIQYISVLLIYVCFWRNSLQWTRASSFMRFLDHTQRRTTIGRTPLDE